MKLKFIPKIFDYITKILHKDVENRTFDDYGYSYAQVDIPQVDVDGHKLNTDNLYYSLILGQCKKAVVK